MMRDFRPFCLPARLAAFAVFAALGASAFAPSAFAQGTHLWTQSRAEDFEKGSPDGVAIESDGKLREAPGTKELLTTPSTFVWSVTADKNGTAFVATGSPASILRLGSEPGTKPFTLFESKDLAVQVVRIGPDGALYAAVMPSGKVYKLNPAATAKQDESTATVVFDLAKADGKTDSKDDASKNETGNETRSRYIWDLTFDTAGRLYVATGGPGAVWRVDLTKPGTAPELFFKSDEAHIRTLAWDGKGAWDAKGNLIAGSDGSGLVYRIDAAGKGYVLFEAPLREITAVAVGADGTIYAASAGDKSRNPLPPLPVQGASSVTITVLQPGSMQAANASASVPEGSEIYAIDGNQNPGQAPRKIWSGKDEVVYSLLAQPDGVLALTGNRGRLFRIRADGSFADIAHLEAQQGLAFAASASSSGGSLGNSVLIGTGNTGKLIALGAAAKHEYASDVLDAGALARFGRVEIDPGAANYQLFTRTGNVEQPVRGWSEWTPLKDGAIASPAGRYLQWKAVLASDGVLGGVGVNYLPVNSAPVIDDLVVVPGARWTAQSAAAGDKTVNINFPSANQGVTVSYDGSSSGSLSATKDRTAVTARWAAHDDNGDDLTFSIYLRGDGEQVWRLLKDGITEKAYSFDQTLLPDGGYELKVVASDAPSHTPGEALTGEKISERFEVDTTPPVVSNLAVNGASFRFDAEDAVSPIEKAEFSLDAGPWQYIEPVGGLSDSKREHYEAPIPASAQLKPGEHLLTVRVYDRHDNIGMAKTVFTTK
jgi:sugar lactone lactonase YvrE